MTRGPSYSWLFCASMIFLGATSIPDSKSLSGEATPMEAMRNTVSQAVGVLQDENLKKPERTDERVTRLKKIADSRFDYGEMAKRTLGSEWKNLGDRERQEFVTLFTELLTATYVDKIHSYAGEEATFLDERLDGEFAEVRSLMVGTKTTIPVNYRLMKKGNDWKAYDVLADGVSMIQNYRAQFAKILRSSSHEHLVQALREKITQFNVKSKSSESPS